jgi:hypothetical protein
MLLFACLLAVSFGRLQCMVWLCLERCNETSTNIQQSLSQLKSLGNQVPLAAFELYNLGPNGQLIVNSDLTNVGPLLKAMGKDTYPMISSYPYPPQFLSWMQQLWQTPSVGDHFISQLKNEAQMHGWTGFQVDWEPTAVASPADAKVGSFFFCLFVKM